MTSLREERFLVTSIDFFIADPKITRLVHLSLINSNRSSVITIRQEITIMRSFRHLTFALTVAIILLNGISCSKGARVESLAISPYTGSTMANGMTHIANGTTQVLIATATLTDGSMFNFSPVVEWSSSNPNIYIDNVVSKGTVSTKTAIDSQATDTTTITAIDTVNHVSASIIVVVTAPQSLAVTPANPHMHFGAIHQFLAEATFIDIATQAVTTQDVTSFSTWTVSPIGYAYVTNALVPGMVGGGIVSIPTGTVSFTPADIEVTFASLPTGSTPLIITGVPISSVTDFVKYGCRNNRQCWPGN